MNYRSLISFYEWIVKGILFAIPFLSLYISSDMLFPFITGRNFWFRMLIEIAAVFWLGLVLFDKKYRPKPSLISIALILFLLIVGVADIFGSNFYNSFWSRYERMEGYLMLLHMAVYFVMVGSLFKTKKDWLPVFNVFLSVGLITAVYAFFQKIGFLKVLEGSSTRVYGTIGNPTYLAIYLVFSLTIALFLLYQYWQKRGLRYFYTVSSLFFLLIIFFTASRGAALALFITATLFLLFYLIAGEKKKLAVGFLATLAILPLLLFVVRNQDFVEKLTLVERLTAISLKETTVRSRLMLWNVAWQGIKERPLIGWGQENFSNVFAKYYNPGLYDQEPWFDRAHNVILDWLINAGILGLLAYLSIFAAAFWTIWSLFKKNIFSFMEASIVFLGLLAYFIQNLLVFDNFNSYLMFFTILAFLHSSKTAAPNTTIEKTSKILWETYERKKIALAMAGIIGLMVILPSLYFINIKPAYASSWLLRGMSAAKTSGFSSSQLLGFLNKALSYDTFGNFEILERMTQSAVNMPPNIEQNKKFIMAIIDELEKQSKFDPENVKLRLYLSTSYLQFSIFDAGYLEKAKPHLLAALRLSPKRQQVYFVAAEYLLRVQDFKGAVIALTEAIKLEPKYKTAYLFLAKAAVLGGDHKLINEVVAKLLELDKDDYKSIADIANFYANVGHVVKAEEMSKLSSELAANNPLYHAELSGKYFEEGKIEEARAEALRARELDPATYEIPVQKFLKRLEKEFNYFFAPIETK